MDPFIGERKGNSDLKGLATQWDPGPKDRPKIEPDFFPLDQAGTHGARESCSALYYDPGIKH